MRLERHDRPGVLIETAIGMHERRRDRRRLPGADGGDGLRRRRLRRVAPEPHGVDWRGPPPRTRSGSDADERERHWGDQWHYPLARIAVACRAHGLRPIDGPYGDFSDPEGYRGAARRAAVLGYEGKWAIHLRRSSWPTRSSPRGRGRGEDAPDRRGDARGRARAGRGLTRWAADRRRLDPHGGEPAREARADRGARARQPRPLGRLAARATRALVARAPPRTRLALDSARRSSGWLGDEPASGPT